MSGSHGSPGPLRVLISSDGVGGVWDYTVALARGLIDGGHSVRLAIVGRAAPDRMAELPDGVDVVSADYRLEWMPGAGADIAPAGEWLARSAREWRADVVHLNQMAYAVHDFDAPTLVVVHSDVLSWFSEAKGTAAPPEWDEYGGWVRRGLAAADVVATPSAYQSALTLRHYGRAADRVIHNGLQPPISRPGRRRVPLVVSAGRAWDEAKGMAVLDAAVGLLGGAAPEVHVLGETVGPHGQAFAARHVQSHGRVTRAEVDAWVGHASVYVGASVYEPFGLAPLEAALRGAALVLSDIPSFRELWDGCARFFPPGDARALADALAELVPDLRASEALGTAARERALERYSLDRFTESYLDLYAGMRLELEAKPSCV